jgi:hypothetical protein
MRRIWRNALATIVLGCGVAGLAAADAPKEGGDAGERASPSPKPSDPGRRRSRAARGAGPASRTRVRAGGRAKATAAVGPSRRADQEPSGTTQSTATRPCDPPGPSGRGAYVG